MILAVRNITTYNFNTLSTFFIKYVIKNINKKVLVLCIHIYEHQYK